MSHATADLAAVITRLCALRGDDERNRRALIAECVAMPPNDQAAALEHFRSEVERWERACRGIA